MQSRVQVALLASLLGAFLFLPENTTFDLPLMPTIQKNSISALIALLLILIVAQSRSAVTLPGLLPRNWIARILIAVLILGEFGTVLTNGDFLSYGPRQIQGLRIYDAFSFAMSSALTIVPLLLARKVLGRPDDNRLVLMALCFAALGYSLLALYEVRMSPQLHRMVYGFFPHNWLQHVRGSGYRPTVFLAHGLVLSLFFSLAVMATFALARTEKGGSRGPYYIAALWLMMTLVLSKSVGALLIALMLTPVVLFFSVRAQLIVSSIIATIVLIYPVLRSAGLSPVNLIYETALKISPARASSFLTRLQNEDRLLEKAIERIHFGWGGWGRSRVYSDYGIDISITDGLWVGQLGTSGWVGYIGLFGLMALPIYLLLLRRKRYDIGVESSALAVILAANMVDLIPNSTMTPITWIVAGTLIGRLEYGRIKAADVDIAATTRSRREPKYNRQFGEASARTVNVYDGHRSADGEAAIRFSRRSTGNSALNRSRSS